MTAQQNWDEGRIVYVPNFEGSFLRGIDNGRGWDSEAGRVIGSTETDTFASHNHDLGFTHSYNGAGASNSYVTLNTGNYAAPYNVQNTGGAETRPKNVAVAYIIKYQLSTQPQGAQNPDKTWKLIYSTVTVSNAQTLTVNGLNGNADESYMIVAKQINNGSTACGLRIRPNGDSNASGYTYVALENSGTAWSNTTGDFSALLFLYAGSGGECHGSATLNAKTGSRRFCSAENIDSRPMRGIHGSWWKDTSTNITSLQFWSDTANGIGAGTEIKIFIPSTTTVSVGVASQLASNTNAVIQADQDGNGDGVIDLKVGNTTVMTVSSTSVIMPDGTKQTTAYKVMSSTGMVDTKGNMDVITSNTFVDVIGASVTITTSGNTKILVGGSVTCTLTASPGSVAFDLWLDGASMTNCSLGISVQALPADGTNRVSPLTCMSGIVSAGTHTIQVKALTTAGNLYVNSNTSAPLILWAQEIR